MRAIERFASLNEIPVVRVQRREPKEEVARRQGRSDTPHIAFGRQSRPPNHDYAGQDPINEYDLEGRSCQWSGHTPLVGHHTAAPLILLRDEGRAWSSAATASAVLGRRVQPEGPSNSRAFGQRTAHGKARLGGAALLLGTGGILFIGAVSVLRPPVGLVHVLRSSAAVPSQVQSRDPRRSRALASSWPRLVDFYANRVASAVIRISVIIVGVFLVGAALMIARRPRDDQMYGGAAAFLFHLFVIACVGIALITGALLSAPAEAIAFLLIALGLSDVIVGVVARRRQARPD